MRHPVSHLKNTEWMAARGKSDPVSPSRRMAFILLIFWRSTTRGIKGRSLKYSRSIKLRRRSHDTHRRSGSNGWYVSNVSLEMLSDDTTSGLSSAEYDLDETSWKPLVNSITLTDGRRGVLARSKDRAGNSTTASILIKVEYSSTRAGACIGWRTWFKRSARFNVLVHVLIFRYHLWKCDHNHHG